MVVEINKFLKSFNYDVRISGNARFIDQKVTPDVLYIVSNCVLEYVKNDSKQLFSTKDIWESKFANQEVKNIFNKPDVLNSKARNEYDKFFQQPLKMLEYSKVLSFQKKGNRNYFSINNYSILEYISYRERNCLTFINLYLKKVLNDSSIWNLFDSFFKENTKANFNTLKDSFVDFMIKYTKIKKPTEPRRIFTKVINPIAYQEKSLGTKRGFLSTDIIGFDELMYNRKNWRDLKSLKKMKGETRQGYKLRAKDFINKRKLAYGKFTMGQAKNLIIKRYDGVSEVQDEIAGGLATQVHHIFPRNEFPEIESYIENLILLTASQHYTKAHPNNNTRKIDKAYQYICLQSKCDSIQKSKEVTKDGFYSKKDFSFILNVGIGTNNFNEYLSFDEIRNSLTEFYHN
jgi:hypothetical protein